MSGHGATKDPEIQDVRATEILATKNTKTTVAQTSVALVVNAVWLRGDRGAPR